MVLTDWEWVKCDKKTPIVDQIKAEAERLIRECVDNDYDSIACGGLRVAKVERGLYELEFILTTAYRGLG